MNTKFIIFLFIFSLTTIIGYGQKDIERKIHHTTLSRSGQKSKIIIGELNAKLLVESHTGNRVEIEAVGLKPVPKRAEGLRPLGARGVDNTDMGLSIQEVDNVVEVYQTHKRATKYIIRIPQNMALKIDFKTIFSGGGGIEVNNINQEIEINSQSSKMKLTNITGPAVLHSIGGLIEVIFDKVNQSSPISISSSGGEIDISLPSSTKASFDLKSTGGDIYTDLELKADKDSGEWKQLGGQHFGGTLNGGGVKISVSSWGGRIYIRDKNKAE